MSIDLEEYRDFVISVTSEETLRHTKFMERMADLAYRRIDEPEVNWPQLLTAAVGLPAETGEFSEIIKKCVFQGKEMGESTHFHAVRELGDIMWYWMQAVYALNVTPEEVIQENIRKLEARYPGGFEAFRSENRQEGDI
jgi:NTP pyrophosphatase (non-canonical NTP hydrolase)|tara:strand:- start:5290 stop:5706 length:417 start_codon:yes stop_codon:yes gene_type:complete